MVIHLERCVDLHMAQPMPLPLTVSCFSKIQIGFTFLVLAHPGSPGQRAVKRVCVCVVLQEHIGNPDFARAARQLILKWTFYRSVLSDRRQLAAALLFATTSAGLTQSF